MADSNLFDSSESFSDFDESTDNLSGVGFEVTASGDAVDHVDDSTAEVALESAAMTVGEKAEKSVSSSEVAEDTKKKKGSLFADFNIYDGILLASLLCIVLATFFVFWEVSNYGGIGGAWRTGSVGR